MAEVRAIPSSELFDAEFLESLKRLRMIARRTPRGGRFAEQRSEDMGHGLEFRDFRPYAPGDDFRAIDWNIYRRLGRVFLRLFEELEDLPLYVMPDVSRSMYLEESPRARAGLRASLALSAISLNHHDSVGLFPFAEDLSVLQRPQAGKGRVLSFAKKLGGIEPGGETDLARSITRFNALGLRRGVLCIVSDFFDPAGLDAVIKALKRVRHKLLLVQLVRPSDRDPDVSGDLRLIDCETGVAEDVSVTKACLDRYREAYDRFATGLAEFAKGRNAGLVQVDVEEDIVPQLAMLFESGRFVA